MSLGGGEVRDVGRIRLWSSWDVVFFGIKSIYFSSFFLIRGVIFYAFFFE